MTYLMTRGDPPGRRGPRRDAPACATGRNAPGGQPRPTGGRAPLPARGVALRLWFAAPRRDPRLASGQWSLVKWVIINEPWYNMALPPIVRLLRPKQWIKNGFVAAPLFFTPDKVNSASLLDVLAGFAVFCMVASAVYCLNDLRDAEGDRNHPVKKNRPIASGATSPVAAMVSMALLLAGGAVLGAWRTPMILWVVGAYFATNIAYMLRLKHIAILDVLIVAFGFVLRVEAGALIIDTVPSAWILIVTGLLALFIALAKRRDDIVRDLDAEHTGQGPKATPS